MKFWQCVVAALFFHMAILMIPVRMTEIAHVGEVSVVITEKVYPPTVSAVVPAAKPPEIKKQEPIVKPRPIVKPKPKPLAKAPEVKPAKKERVPDIKPEREEIATIPEREKPLPTAIIGETSEVPHTDTVEEHPFVEPEISQTVEDREPVEMSFGTSEGPKFLRRALPVYPRKAKMLRKNGTVTLMLTINEKGILVHVEVVKGAGYGFDEESIRAVKQSTFISARKNGKPFACKALLPVRFQLR